MSAQPADIRNFQGDLYMPLILKRALIAHGIRQPEWAKAITQANGRPLSEAAGSLLINWGRWPKQTGAESIRQQTEALLLAKGARPEELADIWEIDGGDEFRARHPAGAHAGNGKYPRTEAHYLTHQKLRLVEPTIDPVESEMLSQEAKRHFQLFRDPFQADVNSAEDVYLNDGARYIRQAMYMTAKHGGFIAVIAESGGGKSVLRRDLVERVMRESAPIRIIFPRALDKNKLSASNICEAIINDLQPGTTVPSSLEAKARRVEQVLIASAQADNSHVLVIEEAHDLSIQTLKYLKRFFELEHGFKKLLGIILIGQPELKDKLDERRYPEAREVIRRIEIAELAPLDNHLEDYLRFKFKRIEKDVGDLFDSTAFDAIRGRLTKGRPGTQEVKSQLYPLIVNNLATKALNRAAALKLPLVTGDLVREL